ncbi:MAG: YciI family protein [Pseudoxanthomonas sp.]
MWYVIVARDAADSLPKRLATRPAHLARLQALLAQGRLLVAGACPAIDAVDPGPAGFSGSVIIAEFESLEAAQAWAAADPFVEAGVYEQVEVRPFRKALP